MRCGDFGVQQDGFEPILPSLTRYVIWGKNLNLLD